jgi:hypothetical protein
MGSEHFFVLNGEAQDAAGGSRSDRENLHRGSRSLVGGKLLHYLLHTGFLVKKFWCLVIPYLGSKDY